jgi:ABC-type phosphate transport system substrate-binding protein
MRKVLLLVSVLLLGACWAAAQDSTNSSSSPASPTSASAGQTGSATSSGANTVEGCLSGSSGNYTLTAKDGTTYQLTGDTAKLSEHVGHEVKITGTSSAASSNAGGTATGTAGASSSSQTLEVSSVKHVSKTCQNGTMSK